MKKIFPGLTLLLLAGLACGRAEDPALQRQRALLKHRVNQPFTVQVLYAPAAGGLEHAPQHMKDASAGVNLAPSSAESTDCPLLLVPVSQWMIMRRKPEYDGYGIMMLAGFARQARLVFRDDHEALDSGLAARGASVVTGQELLGAMVTHLSGASKKVRLESAGDSTAAIRLLQSGKSAALVDVYNGPLPAVMLAEPVVLVSPGRAHAEKERLAAHAKMWLTAMPPL
jgi:hypothetical protein